MPQILHHRFLFQHSHHFVNFSLLLLWCDEEIEERKKIEEDDDEEMNNKSKFYMKWILLPVRYHSVHLSTHRSFVSFHSFILHHPFFSNVYKCPSEDRWMGGRKGEREREWEEEKEQKRKAWQAQVKWMENTERIKNECSMMRHKKVTCKLLK